MSHFEIQFVLCFLQCIVNRPLNIIILFFICVSCTCNLYEDLLTLVSFYNKEFQIFVAGNMHAVLYITAQKRMTEPNPNQKPTGKTPKSPI